MLQFGTLLMETTKRSDTVQGRNRQLLIEQKFRKTILIVDDEPAIVEMLEMLLDDTYNTIGCTNSEEILQKVYDLQPDIILLDLMMPGQNGLQVLENLRANPTFAIIPVVLMTAGNSYLGLKEEEIKELQAVILKKPFDNYKLLQLIEDFSL